jgi:hypothetical protein
MRHPSLALRLFALLFVASAFMSACAVFESADCRQADLATYADTMSAKLKNFQQQAELVAASPRMSMAIPLQRLLDLQNETHEIFAPGCVRYFHEQILSAMETQQRGFQQFAAQGDEMTALGFVTIGRDDLEEATAELDAIRAGTAPTPVPTPEPVSPPEPGAVDDAMMLLNDPGGTGIFQVCPSDQFEVIGRRTEGETVWARVRITRQGTESCTEILGRAPREFEGWLKDTDVKAP